MNMLPPVDYLVNTLRRSSVITAEHYCQCGTICRNGQPCLPALGEVEVIYTTVAEKVQHATGRKMWAAFSYDPMSDKRYIHNNNWHPSPCKAVNAALTIARESGYQLRLDKAGEHHELTVDLSALERKLASDLYQTGYAAYLDSQRLPRNPHPLTTMGYNTARNETTAAIADKDPGYLNEPGSEFAPDAQPVGVPF